MATRIHGVNQKSVIICNTVESSLIIISGSIIIKRHIGA